MNLTKITNKLTNNKWAIRPEVHDILCRQVSSLVSMRSGGLWGMLAGNPVVTKTENISEPEETTGNIAILSVSGIITKGASEAEEELLGLTNIDAISSALDELAEDPNISSIIMAFSSPGGETVGVEELGRKIRYIDANVKPIYGWTESESCSASFWLMSQCRYIGMTPSSKVGSVGVYMLILDETKKLENEGSKIEIFSAGKYKMLGHTFRTLTDEERSILQADVDKQYEMFKSVVKSTRTEIKDEDLNGLTFEGEEALEKGFVDCIGDSFSEFIDHISTDL
jgi:protease-4